MPPASVLKGVAAALLLAASALRGQAATVAAERCDEREDDAAGLLHVQSLKRAARLKPEASPAPSPDEAITPISSAEDLIEGLAAASVDAGGAGEPAVAAAPKMRPRGFPGGGGGLFKPKTAKQWVRQIGATRTSSFTVKRVNKTFDEVFERGLTTPTSDFDYQVGYFGLPLSVAVVNDFPVDVVVVDYEVRNGYEFSGPQRNATIPAGDAAVWHIYTSATDIELVANVIVQDRPKTKLSLAASRYRVANVFKGCDKMRGLMAWGDDVEQVYYGACDLSYPGMRKKTEYEFAMLMAVSLADAEAAAAQAAIAKAATDAVMHAASEQFKNR